jgi:homoserine dehydrogenase
VQLRFEASVCAAIPVIKVLRESLVASNVHRVLGIVNGTTNYILSGMEAGQSYDDALADAQRLGYAEADPAEDVGGLDAAAKTAILATVAFGSRVPVEWVDVEGIEGVRREHVSAARAMEMHVKLVARATLVGDRVDVRVGPALVDARHPLAAVEGAFNAVMLQGDSIREIVLEGPGAGGVETASAVVADLVSIVGTTGTGFLQNEPVWRELEQLPEGDLASPWYLRLEVDDRAGVLARLAQELAREDVSVARLVQQPADGYAVLHIVTHEAPAGGLARALAAIRSLPESRGEASALPVVSDRGVEELGWA